MTRKIQLSTTPTAEAIAELQQGDIVLTAVSTYDARDEAEISKGTAT